MRRKSRPRVVWLPPTNANALSNAGTAGYQLASVDASGAVGDFALAEIPLVIDGEGQDPLNPADVTSLADVYDSGYRLRRIVGKIWIAAAQQALDTPVSVVITAGLIVRRIDPVSGQSLAFQTLNGELLAPGKIRNFGDPWIWRRSWIVANQLATGAPTSRFIGQQQNFGRNAGSVSDGPHVDQKTARTVSSEERLFLDVSSTVLEAGGDPQVTLPVSILTDLRVLGSLMSSTGNRNNSSR